MGRPGLWRRESGFLTLTPSNLQEQVALGTPGLGDGWTLVRAIGSITVSVEPNEFTGFQQVWLGLCATDQGDFDPAEPMLTTGFGWLWWKFFAMAPLGWSGPATADHRFGSAYHYTDFDVHGYRIMNFETGTDRLRFYTTFGFSPDPPAVVRAYYGISSYYLAPP